MTGDNRTCCYFFAIGAFYRVDYLDKIPGPAIVKLIRTKVELFVRKDCWIKIQKVFCWSYHDACIERRKIVVKVKHQSLYWWFHHLLSYTHQYFYFTMYSIRSSSPSPQRACHSNLRPNFQNCTQNDVMTACLSLPSFHKKTIVLLYGIWMVGPFLLLPCFTIQIPDHLQSSLFSTIKIR